MTRFYRKRFPPGAAGKGAGVNGRELLRHAAPVREAYAKHGLATHAAAIAFRVLVALVPLTLLGLALLGALGLEDVWGDEIAPEIERRLQLQVFAGADYIVNDILRNPSLGLIVFAAALLLWHVARGVRSVTRALNTIHEAEDTRSWQKLAAVTLGLSFAVGACLITATLVTIVGGRLGWLAATARWPIAVVLLGLGVALLVRYAPAEQPEPKWASVGSAVIVGGWLVLSVAFGIWVRDIASYSSAIGSLFAFLILTAYVLGLSAVFLIGVEIDESLRNGARPTRAGGGRSGRARSSASRRPRRRSSSRRGS
jgi:membrane protein